MKYLAQRKKIIAQDSSAVDKIKLIPTINCSPKLTCIAFVDIDEQQIRSVLDYMLLFRSILVMVQINDLRSMSISLLGETLKKLKLAKCDMKFIQTIFQGCGDLTVDGALKMQLNAILKIFSTSIKILSLKQVRIVINDDEIFLKAIKSIISLAKRPSGFLSLIEKLLTGEISIFSIDFGFFNSVSFLAI